MVREEVLLSFKEAVQVSGFKPQKLHRAIKDGSLKAQKLGWVWIITERDLIAYLDSEKNLELNTQR